jgi:hypothetical protein
MVEVKLSLMKRDFVWIGLIVVLLGVGFGYAYGGSEPSVMGHSAGEIEESDPTVLASVKNGVSWNEIAGKPAGFADGVDNVGGGSVGLGACIYIPGGGCVNHGTQLHACPATHPVVNAIENSYIGSGCSGETTSRIRCCALTIN